jgi:CRP-like cAMP-binding protein
MNYNKLRKFLFNYVELNFVEWHLCEQLIQTSYYKKGETIQFAGDVCEKLVYINSGIVRSYFLDENANDFTWEIHFNDENSQVVNLFVVDYDSFLEQSPTQMYIEVIEDCELFWITYDNLQLLYKTRKKFERLGRLILEDGFKYLQKRLIDLSIRSSKDRYEAFMKSYEYILKKVPQYHIASYLRISPQHLSTIKKKINQ